jgi:hypothetical protein
LSEENKHIFVTVPEKMTELYYQIDGCTLRFDWTAPEDGNSEITSYSILVLAGDGSYKVLDNCGQDPQIMRCDVPLDVLRGSEFNLGDDDAIVASIRANNIKGSGDVSDLSTNQISMIS